MVFPLKRAAQERAQAERAAAISNFKMMLQERGDISSSARWSKEKLKEREIALCKRKGREEQEVERVKLKALRKEASWTESRTKMEKDPQGRAANPHLDKSDLEKLFREHIKSLHERCVLEFRALLSEVVTVEAAAQETEDDKTIITSWSTAKQVLKKDHRYNKVPRKERESLWRRHAEDIQRKQKSMHDQETDGKTRSSVDSEKRVSGSKITHDRR